jgi:GNAT superfamily N-acetyltransferase
MSPSEDSLRRPGLHAPVIPGLALRPYRGKSDHHHIKAIHDACRDADHLYFGMTLDRLAEKLGFLEYSGRCDLLKDMSFAEIDGRIVGYGHVESEQEATGDRIYSTYRLVVPTWRRRGIGAAILRANECRIHEADIRHRHGGTAMLSAGFSHLSGQREADAHHERRRNRYRPASQGPAGASWRGLHGALRRSREWRDL